MHVLLVESTFKFPEVGRFWLHGDLYSYTSKTDGAFHGVTLTRARELVVPMRSMVVLDVWSVAVGDEAEQYLPQTVKGMRSTLLTYASGRDFDRIATLHGVPRPGDWPEESWRAALQEVAFGPRGRMPGTWAFVSRALKHFWVERTLSYDPAQPGILRGDPGTFAQADVGTYVEITDGDLAGVYWTVGPADVDATDGSYIELARIETAYWDAFELSALDAGTTVATFIPLSMAEPNPGPHKHAGFPAQGSAYAMPATIQFGVPLVGGEAPPFFLPPQVQWILLTNLSGTINEGDTITAVTTGSTMTVIVPPADAPYSGFLPSATTAIVGVIDFDGNIAPAEPGETDGAAATFNIAARDSGYPKIWQLNLP